MNLIFGDVEYYVEFHWKTWYFKIVHQVGGFVSCACVTYKRYSYKELANKIETRALLRNKWLQG